MSKREAAIKLMQAVATHTKVGCTCSAHKVIPQMINRVPHEHSPNCSHSQPRQAVRPDFSNRGYATDNKVAPLDNVFEMAASSVRFGVGVTREIGMDLKDMNAKKVCVFSDPNLTALENSPVNDLLQSLSNEQVKFSLYSDVRVEPTDSSFKQAIEYVRNNGPFDAFVAIGGGSTIDTAKAANLYTTYPSDFLDYVNPPIGKGKPVPGQLKPLIAIPTTAGSGSETTGVAIFDLESMHAKTGIGSRLMKPMLGVLDPLNTVRLPRSATIASALDQLCHSLESYTAMPYDQRPRPERPALRPAYQGSNPISDVWAMKSLGIIAEWLPKVMKNPSDIHGRSQLMLASTYAGIGFGNAGVHLCHGMSYAVSGLVKPHVRAGEGYPDRPLVPHGVSVCINAPAVFKFTGPAAPERHKHAAKVLLQGFAPQKADAVDNVRDEDAGHVLYDALVLMMNELGVPLGLSQLGYTTDDIPKLVEGTLPQHRVTKLSPRPVDKDSLAKLFEDAMKY